LKKPEDKETPKYLDHISDGILSVKRRMLLYGLHGVGKTTWAARWPNAILIPTEEGHHHINVTRGPMITKTESMKSAIEEVSQSSFGTLIVDSIDWLEMIIQREIDSSGVDQSFGKGAYLAGKKMREILDLLTACRNAGKHVILLGHAAAKVVQRPDGLTYETYAVKLTKNCARVVSEWCDEMLFCERDYLVREQANGKHGVGVDKGTRSLYTVGTPSFEAKNRIPGLPEKFDLSDVDGYLSFANNGR
jgi:hypothetical protein